MNESDSKACESAWQEICKHNGDHDWVTFMLGWQAALAHRDAQPAVAVNQRMRTALQEIANTVNYAQWYQETAEKALEDANHTEVALDKVAAVAVNEQTLSELKNMVRAYVRLLEAGKDRIESLGGDCDPVDRMEAGDSNLRTAKAAIAAAQKELGK